ncbi:3-deoxy-7-phosphoheptulonate synthase [Gammaproteobacteria bacterium SCGC AG-212-F23]|nr:3-deoxy-7-phosphoheptulonate synthase [Gammaproteobacteria bacterium SCGC AG-212-F23]
MILVIKENTVKNDIDELIAKLRWMKLENILTEENGRYHIAIVNGGDANTDFKQFSLFPCVEQVLPFTQKFKLASRAAKKQRSVIQINGRTIGNNLFAVMAGPCSIESEEQIHETAALVAKAGANILRGGAFKPRTSPYEFQGLGKTGLQYMQAAAKKNNLLSVSEVMDTQDIELVANYVDILQIGARNMQNFSLLKQVGKTGKPILLKRGLSATYMDFLMAAEYILQTGNPNVILCERGIRTFETYARNTLDIAAIPILHELSHLPVIIDPSHGTGIREAVPPMAYAAIAAGADGIMVEVHPDPDKSYSDAKQTISPQTFTDMMNVLRQIGKAVNIHVQ